MAGLTDPPALRNDTKLGALRRQAPKYPAARPEMRPSNRALIFVIAGSEATKASGHRVADRLGASPCSQ
jgi:hypothetical protein